MPAGRICLNEQAAVLVEHLVDNQQALGIEHITFSGRSQVLDAGINSPGSLEAGRLVAEASLGGLGRVEFVLLSFDDFWLPGIQVTVQEPSIACLASQYAGWSVQGEGFSALGSGPARALAAKEEVFKVLAYREQARRGVLILESDSLPPEQVARKLAAECGLQPQHLWLIAASTASIVGSVQVAARVVETGLHKLLTLGYDINCVRAAFGTCPLAPVAQDDLTALGRTNDAVLYGGRCFYTVADVSDRIQAVVDRVPSSASSDYGTLFLDLFKGYGDFYDMDPLLFSPAEVVINNQSTGRVHRAGSINADLLRASLLEV